MLTWIIGGVAAAVVVRIAVKSQKKLRTPNVETGNNSQTEGLQKEKKHRKLATELKCQKRFREAALEMWRSFEALQEIGLSPTLANLYRYPRYLFMAGDYEKCATFCELMAIGKPFGNVGAGNDDCQRTRMFYSLAAEAYEKTGDVSNAERCWQRVENAGSDNQIYVDRAVADYLAGGYTIGIVRDDQDSDHPAYEKFKGKLIRLTEKDPHDLPLYSEVRATGLFADDDYPVSVFSYDELIDAPKYGKPKKRPIA
mgnify:CR=1 FL=1|jgi:tetratricopeptide (TPR) repeat protein